MAHTAAPLLNYMSKHDVHIAMPRGMTKSVLYESLQYGVHSSDLKEKHFIRQELLEQLWEFRVAIFYWEEVKHFPGLHTSPLPAIPYTGRNPWSVYDLSWSGMNKKSQQAAVK